MYNFSFDRFRIQMPNELPVKCRAHVQPRTVERHAGRNDVEPLVLLKLVAVVKFDPHGRDSELALEAQNASAVWNLNCGRWDG